jgi:hypothetical protein
LVRARLLRLADRRHGLLLTFHHLIADAWSIELLRRELFELCAASAPSGSILPPLSVQYKDYAAWQQQRLDSGALEEHRDYWLRKLSQDVPQPLDLPLDRPRPVKQTFDGAAQDVFLSAELTAALECLGHSQGATLFMVLLAAVQVLLYRCTAQARIAVGTQVAGRDHCEAKDLVGFFVNTVVIVTHVTGRDTLRGVLRKVRQEVLDAFAHQEFPFDQVVEQLPIQRSPNRNPLFDVQVDFYPNRGPSSYSPPGGGWRACSYDVPPARTKYDLSFVFTEGESGVQLRLVYNTSLFSPETVAALGELFLLVLRAAVAEPDQAVSAIVLGGPRGTAAPVTVRLDL